MLLQQFQQQLTGQFRLSPAHHRLLLAVSGGADSVVLVHLTAAAGFDFVIAHCNFQLRGAESERDEAFVRSLGEQYAKPVLVNRFATQEYAAQHNLGIQEAARALRYAWFTTLLNDAATTTADEQTPRLTHLVTAHHANDNIETMLMHLFRGTGLHGLTGIPEQDPARHIIRPLLFAKREAIEAYVRHHQLAWVEDSSNSSEKYTRNFFRLHVLPGIKTIYPAAEDNLLHTLQRLKEAEQLYMQGVDQHRQKLLTTRGNEVHIPVLKLLQANPVHSIIHEIIKPYGFTPAQTDEVYKLLHAATGSYVASATHRILRNRKWLIIAPLQTEAAKHILVEQPGTNVVFSEGSLHLQTTAVMPPPTSKLVAAVDEKQVRFPLILRQWKQGDYFYPLGMQKKKKLSRFFIDNKLSKTEKEKVWVIESDKKIIWVIGHRIDDRFKIKPNTKQCLEIRFTPAG